MRRVSFDTETFPIRPGRQAPLVVCVQTLDSADGTPRVELREEGLDRLEAALADDVLLIGHRIAYDALVSIASRPRLLAPWIRAYEVDRVTCTYEREKLIRIAEGSLPRYPKHGLIDLIRRYKVQSDHVQGDKDSPDSWRTRYHELDGVPVEGWPADATRYALADLSVDGVWLAQETAPRAWLVDQYRQARAAFWLGVTAAWGMRVDPASVAELGRIVDAEHEIVRTLLGTGSPHALAEWCRVWNEANPDAKEPMTPAWVRVPYFGGLVRPTGSKDTKAAAARMVAVCSKEQRKVPHTKKGLSQIEAGIGVSDTEYVSLDVDACTSVQDPILMAYARYTSVSTLRGRVARLRAAAERDLPIQPRYDCLKETGRTSCSAGDMKPGKALTAYGDQVQNLPRSPGLRECYVARPGHVLISVDWRAAELHTLAQTCLDLGLDSNMARILNSGKDIHTWFGGVSASLDYETIAAALKGAHGPSEKKRAKGLRQGAKACDFGFPGGLGIEKFRAYAAKTYGVFYSPDEAKAAKSVWLDAFPEMVAYFAHISDMVERGDPLVSHRSGRVRGGVRYTSAANSYFQGRAADMAKDAGWRLMRETLTGALPARLWAFAHDEFLLETPELGAHDVAMRVVGIMEDAGRTWCPGAPVSAEPAMCRIWRKGAEPTYKNERLIPWEDREIGQETLDAVSKMVASGRSVRHTSWVVGLTEERVNAIVGG